MADFPELSGSALALVMLALGVLNCFLGYRWFKLLISIWGLVLGGAIFGGAAYALTGHVIAGAVGGVIGGILGMTLMVCIYFTGVFVIGFLLGGVAALTALTVWAPNLAMPAVTLTAVAAGLLGGGLALVVQRVLIIVATAVLGAFQTVLAIFALYEGRDFMELWQAPPPAPQDRWLLAAWGILALTGAIVQFRTPRKKPQDENAKDAKG